MDVVKVAKALADPLRFEILKLIAKADQPCCTFLPASKSKQPVGICVCDLVEGLGMQQSKISYHIKELKEAELIQEETRGRWNYYALKQGVLEEFSQKLNKELNS